jgi:succinyl-CoA synthetase alpha subunit
MSILVNKNSRVVVQGLTGKEGMFHTEKMIEYGSPVVAGVTPGKAGQTVLGLPVFNTVADAVKQTGADTSICFVPAAFAADAACEASDAGIKVVVVISEHIPVMDLIRVKAYLKARGTLMVGPNCPGIITPGQCKVGIMPGYIHKPGPVGVISRSGTLTYEAVWQLSSRGMGQSTCIGIGGDPVKGLNFIELLDMFEIDPQTEAVIIIGEIGGTDEEEAARWIKDNFTKPVAAFIAGSTAPKGRRMGHAGAIISGGTGTAADKIKALKDAGIAVAPTPAEIGQTMIELMK